MSTRKIRLGENELRLLFTLEKERKVVFSISDAKRVLGGSDASVWNVVYRLKRKRRIEEIEKGKYLLVPARAGYEGAWTEVPFFIVPHLIDRYYVGFWTALNYWGMTEQVPRTVFVATTKRKRDLEYGPTRFEFVTLAKGRFFGYVEEKVNGHTFSISSREKTVVDCLLYPRYCGGIDEAVKGIWTARSKLDFDRLLEFAIRVKVSAVERRVGYILDLLNLEGKARTKLAAKAFAGFEWLDPLGPRKALDYSRKHGLIVNRTEEELTSWRRY